MSNKISRFTKGLELRKRCGDDFRRTEPVKPEECQAVLATLRGIKDVVSVGLPSEWGIRFTEGVPPIFDSSPYPKILPMRWAESVSFHRNGTVASVVVRKWEKIET